MPRTRKNTTRDIDSYAHADKERVNNPPVGLVTPDTDKLAYDEPPAETMLHDQPKLARSKARVTGPFTVEAVPAPVVKAVDEVVEDPHPSLLPQREGAGREVAADTSVARSGETLWQGEGRRTGRKGR